MTDGGPGDAPRTSRIRGRLGGWSLPILLYPAVFPAVIVIRVWTGTGVHVAMLWRPLIVAIVLGVVVTAVLTLLARSRDLGALAATAVSLYLIAAAALPMTGVALLPAVALLLVIGLSRRGRPWPLGRLITRGMNLVAAITVIAVGLTTLQSGSLGDAVEDVRSDVAGRGPVVPPTAGDPDIYVVLLDAYPGAAAAALDPAWDPAPFIDGLRTRGFDVADDTRSNYLQTPQTVASMLDMRHLVDIPSLDPPYGTAAADGLRLRRAVNDARGLQDLHDRGYELVTIASGFAEPEVRRVDRFVDPGGLSELEVGLLRGTGGSRVMNFLAPDLGAQLQRDRINGGFDALAAEGGRSAERPRFVLAHIAAPHPPWVFAADGSPAFDSLDAYYSDSARDRGITREEALARHFAQATFTGRRTLQAIDAILAASATPPIIVVVSDHGPGTEFDQTAPLESDLVERSSNLLAVYSPGHAGLFARPTTPVNVLVKLFNAYFGTSIPEQPDTLFAWRESRLDAIPVDPADPKAAP